MDQTISGNCFVTGDGITAYQIISQGRWTACGLDASELGKWTFENLYPNIAGQSYGFKEKDRSIVIGGSDFGGGGKSNDHPVFALKGAGVKLLIAESFSRIFFRNCINLGLPAIQCPGIASLAQDGDQLLCDLEQGHITNCSNGNELSLPPLSSLAIEILEADGLLNYCRNNLSTPEHLFAAR